MEMAECFLCIGTGYYEFKGDDVECAMCDGTGEVKKSEY